MKAVLQYRLALVFNGYNQTSIFQVVEQHPILLSKFRGSHVDYPSTVGQPISVASFDAPGLSSDERTLFLRGNHSWEDLEVVFWLRSDPESSQRQIALIHQSLVSIGNNVRQVINDARWIDNFVVPPRRDQVTEELRRLPEFDPDLEDRPVTPLFDMDEALQISYSGNFGHVFWV